MVTVKVLSMNRNMDRSMNSNAVHLFHETHSEINKQTEVFFFLCVFMVL